MATPSGNNLYLTPEQFKLLETLAIIPLKKAGCKVWVFGSRARGDHLPVSDADILFEPNGEFSLFELSQIKELLEESNLPIKVDLVDLNQVAASYLPGILRDRKQL